MSWRERSLYLYFLDRELGNAVEYKLDPLIARRAVQALIAGTSARLICGLSLLYENTYLGRADVEFFGRLVATGMLDTVSHYLSYDEFKASRIALYEHDADRYPAYFSNKAVPAIIPTIQKAGGTTANIVSGMSQWAFRLPDTDPRQQLIFTQLRAPVLNALQFREERAVTFSLFQSFLGDLSESPVARGHIRRAISNLFVRDYLNFGDNDLPTGMRGLAYFEQGLAKDFPFYDIPILARLIRRAGVSSIFATDSGEVWDRALLQRDSESHALFVARLRWIIAALAEVVDVRQLAGRQDEARRRMLEVLLRRTTPQHVAASSMPGDDLYAMGASNAFVLSRQLAADPGLAAALDSWRDEFHPPLRADVLLIVATGTENEAVIGTFQENDHPLLQTAFSETNAYQVFAPIGGARVALVRCSMGPGGPGGPGLTAAEAIASLRPKSAIMVGIAFGIDPDKGQIGQVLLSTHVFDYELQRVGTNLRGKLARVFRGAKPDASPRLLSRFRAARLHTFGLSVREGILLSGAKLVDNVDYREELRALCVEAIGGEMEGFGVYSAAARFNVDWIIVKAISDWADGKKRSRKQQRQDLAARNAALAVLRTLERGGFA